MTEDNSVNRNINSGLCEDCLEMSKYHPTITLNAAETNFKLTRGEIPVKCPCKKTSDELLCQEMDCDGVYLWCKNSFS